MSAYGDARHRLIAISGKGFLYDTPSPNGCHHGAPPPGDPQREDRGTKLINYFFYRSIDEENGQQTGATNMQYISRFPDTIDEISCRILLADATNHTLKQNYEQARIVARLHMTFHRWIQAGKPRIDWDNMRETVGAGVPTWMLDVSREINTIETPIEITKYLNGHLECDCLGGVKKRAKEDSKRLSGECHNCHKRGPPKDFQRCARCKTSTYCGRECQVADWAQHKFHCKALQGKTVTEEDYKAHAEQFLAAKAAEAAGASTAVDEEHKKTAANAKNAGYVPDKASTDSEYLQLNAKGLVEQTAQMVADYEAEHKTGAPPVSEEDRQAAVPGLVEVLKNFLTSHPDYDSPAGLCDANEEDLLKECLDLYMENQPGFESYALYLRRASEGSRKDKSKQLVDKEAILNFVAKFLELFTAEDFPLDEYAGFRENLKKKLIAVLTAYVLDHHEECNSFRGVHLLLHNGKFTILCEAAMIQFQKDFFKHLEGAYDSDSQEEDDD